MLRALLEGMVARARSYARALRRPSAVEAELAEEFRLHIDLRASDLVAAGVPPEEAARRARVEFGHLATHRREVLAARGMGMLDPLRLSRLDIKVGLRMLARYPGITVVGAVSIAVAIALGTLYFEAVNKFRNPELPIAGSDRVVSVRLWDASEMQPESRMLHDFAIWREQVGTLDDIGAGVTFVRNLETPDGRVEPVRGAEVTASAFSLMGTQPLLGRVLADQDERAAEPPVVVIGHRLWKARFASDAAVIGRSVKLGNAAATIVGVMPEGFGFPVNEQIWAPLRMEQASPAPRSGPAVSVFGRLAPGTSMEAAEAELDGIVAWTRAANPDTHRHLKARVTGYAEPLLGGQQAMVVRAMMAGVATIFLTLLAIVCTNVATLVFARTATRGWEITVRSALGASRRRVILQLFAEALVLTGLAAVLGLVIAKLALTWGFSRMAGTEALPFWIDDSISFTTLAGTALLTLFGAAIVGVLPALKATRLNVQDALRNASAAGSGLKFGGFWTTVIVVQVAVTVALMPLAAAATSTANRFMQRAEGIGAGRYMTAQIGVDHEDYGIDADAFAARARLSLDELEQRLREEPGVEDVAFADRLPVMDQYKYSIEVDSVAGAPTGALRTSTMVHVSDGFFATFGTSVIAGRDFAPVEYQNGRVLVVNESFVQHVFGGRNAIGRRIRITGGEVAKLAGDEWYEIIGVVRDFGWQLPGPPHEQSAIYRPALPLALGNLAVRVSDTDGFASRLRQIAADVDPTIRVTDVQPLADVGGGEAKMGWVLTSVTWLVGFIVLTLSAMGIHALVSFTVARRTREIGIRAALGAQPGRIVAGVFSRAFLQIAAGIAAGTAIAALLGLQEILLLAAAAAVMLIVGLAACAVPLRRALRIQPTEALKAQV